MPKYTPRKGEFIALNFDPQSGHEQAGRRSALVISHDLFNKHTGMAIVCPLTNTYRNNPFHLAVPASTSLTGFIMVDQVKSMDFSTRKAKRIGLAPAHLVSDALAILEVCIK